MSDIYLSVIVPAYNEEKRIAHCLDQLLNYLWEYTHYTFEIIVIDNGSQDATSQICQRYQEDWPQLRIISLPEANKGAAVRAGMLAAYGSYRYMADVDLATSASEISRFLFSITGSQADLVIGMRQDSSIHGNRILFHKAFQILTQLFIPGIWDSQCGFKMFRGLAAKDLFGRSRLNGYVFDVEILRLARAGKFKIIQMPVTWCDHSGSKVHPFQDGWRMIRELLQLVFYFPPSAVAVETRQP